ncbi:AI-2E family transporter [Mycetocola zhujimingii]|uniref:AI-2E family transporter n=1 Tax=Mycetocola zhujimingii TaxID=2079792 RepID=A0A2U1TGL2_9MICO|nr:AI-2E family transporter [Mycetocola zhujimingii]AWB86481.1 AI-2E family transporter [Mycetocola zhujimingii]PWC08029.1 AI-2E family transporter [Mycetocola zhujimingii]
MSTDIDGERPSLRTLWTDRLGTVGVRSIQILAIIALAAVVVLGMMQLKLVVIPVLIAIVIAAAAAPVISWLRRFMPPILAAWVALLSGILIFGGVVTLIVLAVRNQWGELADSAVKGIDQLYDYLLTGPLPIDEKQIEEARDAVIDFVTSAQFGSGALAGVSAAANIITGAVLVLVILFFFLKDGDTIWEFFLRPFKGAALDRGHRIGHTAVRVLGGYVRGTAIIAFVDAFFIGLGLFILQVPLALPLAVIVFVASFVPLVGATVASVLAALVALVGTDNGPVVALIVIAIAVGVNQLEGNFLQPVVMAQSLKLHPLVILVALTAGTIVAGIIGAVLAVPIAAVTWAIIKVWRDPRPVPIAPLPRPRKRWGKQAALPAE